MADLWPESSMRLAARPRCHDVATVGVVPVPREPLLWSEIRGLTASPYVEIAAMVPSAGLRGCELLR